MYQQLEAHPPTEIYIPPPPNRCIHTCINNYILSCIILKNLKNYRKSSIHHCHHFNFSFNIVQYHLPGFHPFSTMNDFQISSSSLSSNGTDDHYHQTMASFDEKQELLLRMYTNNNLILAGYLDDKIDDAQSKSRGAIPGHIVINRPREEAAYNFWMDYFTEIPRFGENKFRRRFRMSKNLFHRIADVVKDHDNFFM